MRSDDPASQPDRARLGEQRTGFGAMVDAPGGSTTRAGLAQGQGTHGRGTQLHSPQPQASQGQAAQPRLGIAGLDRRTLTLVGAALLVAWLVLVFGRAISQSNEVAAEAAMLRTQDAALSQQVADRQAELSVIQSPAFLALEARAYGYGKSSEQVFALQPGAPAPPSITPLGAEPSPAPPPAPLDAWLQLLVGR